MTKQKTYYEPIPGETLLDKQRAQISVLCAALEYIHNSGAELGGQLCAVHAWKALADFHNSEAA